MKRKKFDFGWYRTHLLEGLRSERIGGYLTPQGMQSYARPGKRPVRGDLIGQSRQVYCLARGYLITGRARLAKAARRGAEVLIDVFMDDEDGGCYESVGPAGADLESGKTSYGNAHVAFGLSFAARATGDRRFTEAAWRSWEFLKGPMTDAHGGMLYGLRCDGGALPGRKSQNPIMHQFEGLLGLGDCDGCRTAHREAESLARFMCGRLLRREDHVLPEYYRDDWTATPGDEEGCVYIGHAFEWAFFLLMAVDRGFPRRYLAIAEKMMEAGIAAGYDPSDGGVFSEALPEGGLRRRFKSHWEQCEALRTMLRFALLHGRDDLWPYIEGVSEYIKGSFVRPATGMWWFSISEEGRPEPSGGSHRLDYHSLGLCAEVLRLSAFA